MGIYIYKPTTYIVLLILDNTYNNIPLNRVNKVINLFNAVQRSDVPSGEVRGYFPSPL